MNETPRDKVSAKFALRASANDQSTTLISNIRRVSSSFFEKGQKKVVEVRIRRVEEGRIDGFLKVRSMGKHEKFLLDFQATSTSRGILSSLEVDGKRVLIPHGSPKKNVR